MIRLRALTFKPLWLPLKVPLVTARMHVQLREGLELMLEDEEGRRGLGEVTPLPMFGTETLSVSAGILARLAPRLAGQEVGTETGDVDAFLNKLAGVAGVPAARHGLELALLDLVSQARGLPLRALLGGAPLESIRVNALLTGKTPVDLAKQARAARDDGFEVVKLKVGGRALEQDVEALAAVREAAGEDVKVRIDANASWTEAEAIEALGALARFKLELCEQPVAAGELDAFRRVRARVPVPLAADETLAQPGTLASLLEGEGGPCVDALVLKPMVLGGLLPALELARRAARVGVGSYVTSSIDGPVARAGAVHLAAALPLAPYAHGLAVGMLFCEPGPEWLRPKRGTLTVSAEPGLGHLR